MNKDVSPHIIHLLKHYQPKTQPETQPSAAVMVMLLQDDDHTLKIVLTKRALTLPTYAGHFSFPGGMHDADDKDMLTTAKREVQEELNISPDAYHIIGQLDDCHDRYGHLVRPFVSFMPTSAFEKQYQIAKAEIDTLYYFPLTRLNEFNDNPTLHHITRRRPSYAFIEGDVFVWGLTAAILVQLRQLLQSTN